MLLLLIACTGPEGDTGPADTGVDDTGGQPADLVAVGDWEACSLAPGGADRRAECATVTLPWDHFDASRGTFEALLKRVPARDAPSGGQAWLLHGGPGASAVDDLEYLPSGLLDARPDLAVYAIDHRGIGGTVRLDCPEEEDPEGPSGGIITDREYPHCIEHLEDSFGDALDLVSTTQSAMDIGRLVNVLRSTDEPVFLYGGSYGTYLGQRYLQLFPDQPTGVVLDGVVHPDVGLRDYDENMDGAGEALFAVCQRDPVCSGHFDGDPMVVAQSLGDRFDGGHCPRLGVDGGFIRYFMGALLMYDKVRDLLPAVVHRLDRCDEADVDAIVTFYNALAGIGGVAPPAGEPGRGNNGDGGSDALFYHVGLSEMWFAKGEVDVKRATNEWEALHFSTGLETWLAERSPDWPRYPVDTYVGVFADYDGPLLLLEGGLDPASTAGPAKEVAAQFTADHQWFAFVPQGAHGIVNGATLPDGSDCGQHIFQAFLADPEADLDMSCIDEVLPVQFDGYEAYNDYLFGTQDIWGDG